MSEPEIKIVTRTCITCRHEPEWKPGIPISPALLGECRAKWNYSTKDVTLNGQLAWYKNEQITDCPAWEAKVLEK